MNTTESKIDAVALERLEKLAREATPGPWLCCHRPEAPTIHYIHPDDGSNCIGPFEIATFYESGREENRANAELVAAANPQTVLALIARIRDYEETLQWYVDATEWKDSERQHVAVTYEGEETHWIEKTRVKKLVSGNRARTVLAKHRGEK